MTDRNVDDALCTNLYNIVLLDSDYFYGTSLRTGQNKKCYSELHEVFCRIKCGVKSSLCIETQCYCVYYVQNMNKIDGSQVIYLAKPDGPLKKITLPDDFEDVRDKDKADIEYLSEPNFKDLRDPTMYSLRPSLRHHIAHFCPNLEVARQCIRKCMKLGKPAFCGKDHVCYCGHKYTSTDTNPVVNVQEMYGQFHDLYEKYFGTSNNVQHIDEEN
ncbi:uncharacterized protein LOC123721256 [Papilio machaon]|uniref:uncharacterized protein LOC123721256 n=1 Tax=Papilio machaon TaxID=76193 RepID=UPI001E662EE2|nr:uncharacterized protein LOC123721256 [Papilio machaon]